MRVLRRVALWIYRLLPSPRDEAFLALARSGRDLVMGWGLRETQPVPPQDQDHADFKVDIAPIRRDKVWLEPPEFTRGIKRSIYDTGSRPAAYDIRLLETLNSEYRAKPLVPAPPSYETDAKNRTSIARLKVAHSQIGLMKSSVLEIGCSEGHVLWYLGNELGCDAHGVDVDERESWATLSGPNVHFTLADLSVDRPFSKGTFDRVISYTVLEHVLHPYALLRETFRILRPGGLALITANLYAGPKASHRYRDIFFPWPHLLFADETIAAWDLQHGRNPRGSSWVNRLCWAQYQRYFDEIGFRTRKLSFKKTPIDEDFYVRFEDVLGRFPRRDLERDFFTVILEKPRR